MEQQIDTYTTDGTLIRNQQGDCMGIFSTVSLLNDKIRQLEKEKAKVALLKESLAKVKWQKPVLPERVIAIASNALAELKKMEPSEAN